MGRLLKIGVLLTVVFAGLTLLTLRLTGFDRPIWMPVVKNFLKD